MDKEACAQLPASAFKRGIGTLKKSKRTAGVVILGFDCEYDSETQEIVCYQLSDGKGNDELLVATEDLTLPELSAWAIRFAKKCGHDMRQVGSILLVSHYSAAELSHVARFWIDGEVRRVSPQQVFNVTHYVNTRLRVTVFDMFHFFLTGLAKVAKTFGYEKLDYDTSKVTRKCLEDPRFREYAVNDAALCAKIFTDFREKVWARYEVDAVRYCTPASLAMAVYRKHWLKADLEAPPYKVRRLAWLCLWGGRSEAYVCGDYVAEPGQSWTLRDVKSLYPRSAELVGALPTADSWVQREAPKSYRGLCVARFQYPDAEPYPGLPVFAAGRLVFPLRGTTYCTLAEAKAAEDAGAVLEYKHVWEYVGGDSSLAEYMTHFTESKDRNERLGNMVDRELDKLLMNALIGKLSQHKGDVDVEDAKAAAELIGVPLETVLDPGFHHPLKPVARARVGGNVMPEWSALILGQARALMGRLVRATTPLVTSTDSLLVRDVDNHKVDMTMRGLDVLLTDKNANPKGKWCDQCPDPAPVVRIKVLRTRVYAGTCPHGRPVWSATHALHLPKAKDAAALFLLGDETKYVKRVRAGLKTAARRGSGFQAESRQTMRFSRGWDQKRVLLPDGSTQPWLTARQAERRLEKSQVAAARRQQHEAKGKRAKKAVYAGGIMAEVPAR